MTMTNQHARVRLTGQLITGLVLASLGILFTLDNLNILEARDFLRYWPLIFIVVGVSQITQARSAAGTIGGAIWILLGGVMLGERLQLISNVFRFWPMLLIAIGGYVVWQSMNRREAPLGDRADRLSAIAVLGGVDRRVLATSFAGGDVTAFMYCRAMYRSILNTGSGSGWDTDYPAADNNFSVRIAELTRLRVKFDPDRQPHHVVVPLNDPLIFKCPMLFIEDTGGALLADDEVRNLRDYLFKGGFLWSDDSWGTENFLAWIKQLARVLPPGEFPIIDIPPTHPIMAYVPSSPAAGVQVNEFGAP